MEESFLVEYMNFFVRRYRYQKLQKGSRLHQAQKRGLSRRIESPRVDVQPLSLSENRKREISVRRIERFSASKDYVLSTLRSSFLKLILFYY